MPLGLVTVRAEIVTDNTGKKLNLPIVMGPGGAVFHPMVKYQKLFNNMSTSWHKSLCLGVRLLLEYAAANAGSFTTPRDLFESFAVKLQTGTVYDGHDPSGLYWAPRTSTQCNSLLYSLTELSKWMSDKYNLEQINPLRDATRSEQVIAAMAWGYRNKMSFLGHTESKAKAMELLRKTPWVPKYRAEKVLGEVKPRFPEDRFMDLIFKGFVDSAGQLDLRCVLITLLMHGASLRVSECFHLFPQDVLVDPHDATKALVRIGHPELGEVEWKGANNKTVRGSRAEYLMMRGLEPRNTMMGRRKAGWKNPTMEGKWYLQAHWTDPAYGQLFVRVWRLYLEQLTRIERTHPWAFVNLSKKYKGDPFTIAEFSKAHAKACRRIGLIPNKSSGTTPHGHRHACLYRLAEANVDPIIIKRVAHHHSFESQQVYTSPDLAATNKGLSEGYARLEENRRLDLRQIEAQHGSTLKLNA